MATDVPPARMGQRPRVRAWREGVYAFVPRKAGDVFELARLQDLDRSWMLLVGPHHPLTEPPP